ncbi:hypothetical protein [Bradyrhizobium sp. LA6.1]|uniref:hypothetical protein n=1 Tax=Bradyrhizobium sp. LA6.1 TaxID=3156378 RepID=UPI00339AEC65
MTYAVRDVVNWLLDTWHLIDEKHRNLIVKEINEAKERKGPDNLTGLGMPIDAAQWQRLLAHAAIMGSLECTAGKAQGDSANDNGKESAAA